MSASLLIVVIVGGLASGVLSRSFSSAWPYLMVALLVGAFTLVFWRRVRFAPLLIVAVASSFTLGYWRMDAMEARYDEQVVAFAPAVSQEVSFEGMIVRDPELRETNVVLFVEVEGSEQRIRVSASRELEVDYGDFVRVTGVLARPEPFESAFGRMFPYERYLRVHGVTHTISFADVGVVSHGGGQGMLRMLFRAKQRFAESVASLLPEPHASLALGLVLGEKHGLGDKLKSVFRMVGIIHIVVLSGYNLTIVAEALMRLLQPIFLPRMRALIGALAIVAFAVAVGPSATVVRATIMALLVLFARATGRTYVALRALLLAGACMIALNPHALAFDPGFQFSYLATLGLILLGPLVDRVVSFLPSYAGMREYASATIATQIAVAPLILWSIGTVSVIAVVANVLILIAVPIAMLLVFITGIIGLIAPTLTFAAYPAYLVLTYILGAAEVLSRVPFAELILPPFPFMVVACMYACLGGVLIYGATRKRKTPERVASGVSSVAQIP